MILGRIDILHRFLQRIGMDRPSQLNEFTEKLDLSPDAPSIESQIADRIMSVKPETIKHYNEAREELISSNPYGSLAETSRDASRAIAFESFLTEWVQLEEAIRKSIQHDQLNLRRPLILNRQQLEGLRAQGLVDRDDIEIFQHLRRIRNELVHSRQQSSTKAMLDAAMQAKQLRSRIDGKSDLSRDNTVNDP